MRSLITNMALASLAATACGVAGASTTQKPATPAITGDYVEARTASVFAGACHYNGELTTTGRDAEAVWHVRSGVSHGVDVSGLTAIAAITANDNLKDDSTPRRTVLFIDEHASGAQVKALAGLLMTTYKGALGDVVAIKKAPITFTRTGDSFHVDARGVGTLSVDAMPNRECCKQPNLVWYRPLAEVSDRRVGFTRESGVSDATLGVAWTKSNQNTAFYGTFAIGK
jgi:hypothetical protein